MRLGDLSEDEIVARIARASRLRGGVVLGIGDDAAVLRSQGDDWVVSTDARVEDVHFRWASDPPRVVGRTALAAALSDLAAMGARPRGFTWALAAPAALPLARFDGMLGGLAFAARAHACPLVGGNLSRARETSLVLTVFGTAARGRALRRVARAGDRILVTGTLGGAALARARAERGGRLTRVPEPRLRAGQVLARQKGVRGCIDLSDGLEIDLGRLLGPRLGAQLDRSAIPTPRGLGAACRRLGLDPEHTTLRGGEDYELLFTVDPQGPSAGQLERRLGLRVSELGRVVGAASATEPTGGWSHFGPRPGSEG